jgi:hypothetical protein
MYTKDITGLEKQLENRGYKKITQCKAKFDDDYEWYKSFYDSEGTIKYQIFFQFWCWEKYRAGEGWGVSVSIMPESCINNVGRRDLELSVDWADDILRVEDVARRFYTFITEMDALKSEGDPVGRRGRRGDVDRSVTKMAEEYQVGLKPPYDADDIVSAYESGMEKGKEIYGSK